MAEPLAPKARATRSSRRSRPRSSAATSSSASYLLAGATAFFFVAFLFAYFYLRSLNNGGMWKPQGRRRLGRLGNGGRGVLRRERPARAARAGRPPCDAARGSGGSRGWCALLIGVVGLVLQVLAWTHAGLRAGGRRLRERLLRLDGVRLPLRARNAALARDDPGHVVAVQQGRGRRHRRRARRPATRTARRTTSATRSRSSARSSSALSFYWTFLAAIAVVTWIVLYLI